MSNREQLAAIVALVLGGLFGFLLSGAGYGFICGAGILGGILPIPVCLIADRRNIRWAMAANTCMLLSTLAIVIVRTRDEPPPLEFFLGYLGLIVPLGCFVAAVVVSFIDALRRANRQTPKQSADILCATCGYDLRASERRCPNVARHSRHCQAFHGTA